MYPINLESLKNNLLHLLGTPSPAGLTEANMKWLAQQLGNLGYHTERTRTGALKAYLSDSHKPQRALAAHVDTLGAIVVKLKTNGRLSIVPIGSWSSRMAEGCRVRIHPSDGPEFQGTILPLKASVHASSKAVDEQPVNWEQVEIRVDAACWNQADLEALGIQVGDIVSINPQPEIMDNGFIVSRFLDDLGGVACLLTACQILKEQHLTPLCPSMLFFSCAEEHGFGASHTFPASLQELVAVDIAIVAPDQNSREDRLSVVIMDNSGPFHPGLTRHLLQLADELDLPHCRDVFRYYFSDCAAALQAGNDLRHALIGFGTDASHAYERTHIDALEATVQLILAYLMSPLSTSRTNTFRDSIY